MRDDCLDPAKNPRAKHFARKREVAAAFDAAGYIDVADHLRDCQEVSLQCICRDCGEVIYIPDRCRLRVCPLCSYARARHRGRMILALTHRMQWPKLLTLTQPLWRGLPSDGIDYLREAWNKLRETQLFKMVKGGVYQIELKPSGDHWHIHLHALIDAPFLPYQQIFTAWTSILGVQHAEIDIQAATTDSQKIYAAKYCAKAADYEGTLPRVVAWYAITKGKRLFAGFGTWYNIKPEDVESETDWRPEPFACPKCGALKSCVLGIHVHFSCGPAVAEYYQAMLAAAGPPTRSLW